MTRVRDVAFIRKLCAMGLPPQTLAQALLPALREIIPSHSAGVFWVDAQGEMTGLYAERLLPPTAMAAYYERHYHQQRDGFVSAFRRRAQDDDPVSVHSYTKAEQSSAYFNDVLAPLDAYHVLYGVLKQGGRPFAQISFYRGRADPAFGREQISALREVLRYVATGLAPAESTMISDDGNVVVDEQLGIATQDGAIVSAPDAWQTLVRLAALAQVSPKHALHEMDIVQRFLRELCERALKQAEDSRRPTDVEFETAWGRFVVRAFLLADAKGRRAQQVGLLIRREEPRRLSLVRGTGVSGLSPQQREVALLLAQGKSNREIGEELGLTFNTASYHVKQVYARLGVSDRGDVMDRLLRLAQSVAAK